MTTGIRLYADGVDVTCYAWAPAQVTWGRDHPGDSFEPRRLTVSFDGHHAPRRGARLVMELNAPKSSPEWRDMTGTWATQTKAWAGLRVLLCVFDGKVTDADTAWTPVVPHQVWDVVRDITASDPIAALASDIVGGVPWPQETVTQRAQRIEALTPLTWLNDPSSAVVAARDVDAQPASDLLDALAVTGSMSGGLFYDPPTGHARFILDASRASRTPDLVLTACDFLADAHTTESVNDVVNDVTVTYVDPANPDGQPSAHFVNQGSVDQYGTQHRAISTELVDGAVALARAQTQANRFGVQHPRWSDVTLSSRIDTSREVAELLLVALPGLRVRLDDLPAPAASPWDGYTEGWTLTVDAADWDVTLTLSPAAWSGPLLPWSECGTTTWNQVDPDQRWLDTTDNLWTEGMAVAA